MHFDKIKHLPTSTAIEKVEYSTKESFMRVHWRSGGFQDIQDIEEQHYSGLINAASAGRYYHTFINPKHKIVPRTNTFNR